MESKVITLSDAVSLIEDGQTLALGGNSFSRMPSSFVREIARQKKRKLSLVKTAGGYDIDLLCFAEAVSEVIAGYVGFENVFGLCPSFRRSVESGIVKVREHACATVIAGLRASSFGIPSQPIAGLQGSDVPKMTGFEKTSDPYTGKEIFMIPSITPDWAIIHVPYADKYGNARIDGGVFEDILMTRASTQVILTTEQIQETSFFQENPAKTKIPSFLVKAVVQIEQGAFPMSCYPFYDLDNEVIKKYFIQSKSNNQLEEHLSSLVNIDYGQKNS